MISPLLVLSIALGLTTLAWGIHRRITRAKRRALHELARQSRMHYSVRDMFDLARRVAPQLPVIGAADVRVCDLIYGSDQHTLRYVFTAEYTVGVVHSKGRQRCVICAVEPRDGPKAPWNQFEIAPEQLPLLEKYRALLKLDASGKSP